MRARTGAIVLFVAVVVCVAIVGYRWLRGDSPPDQLQQSDPCYDEPVSCVMTDDVGIFDVPLPRPDLQFGSLYEPYPERQDFWATNTRSATWQEYAAFYESYMSTRGWEPVHSETETVDADDGTAGRRMVWSRADGTKLGIFVLRIDADGNRPYTSIWLNNQYGLGASLAPPPQTGVW